MLQIQGLLVLGEGVRDLSAAVLAKCDTASESKGRQLKRHNLDPRPSVPLAIRSLTIWPFRLCFTGILGLHPNKTNDKTGQKCK